MFKVYIWGIGDWMCQLWDALESYSRCEVVGFIQTDKTTDKFKDLPVYSMKEFFEQRNEYDMILIAVRKSGAIKESLKTQKLLDKKVYFMNILENGNFIFVDFRGVLKRTLREMFTDYEECVKCQQKNLKYVSCECNGEIPLSYIVSSEFDYMVSHLSKGVSYQSQEVDLFFKLAETWYGIKPETGGYFLDVGANIGTTSLYAKKRNPLLKIIGFEPMAENIKTFKINCLLNEITDDIELVEKALSDQGGCAELMLSKNNHGDNRVIRNFNKLDDFGKTQIQTISLDLFLKNRTELENIIQYIWMDVQGHEAFVLKGAEKLIQKRRIPLFMEFWPIELHRNQSFSLLTEYLGKYYRGFISVIYRSETEIAVGMEERDFGKLYQLADKLGNGFCDIFVF